MAYILALRKLVQLFFCVLSIGGFYRNSYLMPLCTILLNCKLHILHAYTLYCPFSFVVIEKEMVVCQ